MILVAAFAALYLLLLVTLPPVLIVDALLRRRRSTAPTAPASTLEDLLPLLHTCGDVTLDWLGDSPHIMILGHPEDDDAVATAVRALHRDVALGDGPGDDPELADVVDGLRRTHAVLITECEDAAGPNHPTDGGCGGCADIAERLWAVLLDRADDDRAFPVTVWAR